MGADPGDEVIRLVVVDDHPIFRDGLKSALNHDDIEVIAEAGTAEQAVEIVDREGPDVVLMDLQLPDGSGIEATRAICATHPEARILILTMTEDPDAVFAAIRAGARGYLVKGADRDELVRAIEAVNSGDAVFGSGIAERILKSFSNRSTETKPLPELTDREREVLGLVMQGLTNDAIGGRLFISRKTVRNHVSNILTKLQARDRHDAARLARDAGLGSPSDDQ